MRTDIDILNRSLHGEEGDIMKALILNCGTGANQDIAAVHRVIRDELPGRMGCSGIRSQEHSNR